MTDLRDGEDRLVAGMRRIGGAWGWFVALGIVSIVAGVISFFMPSATLIALAVLLGIELMVQGVFRLVAAFAIGGTGGSSGLARVLWGVLGLLGILLGFWALRNLFATILALGILLAVWWIVDGVGQIIAGFESPVGRGWHFAGGVLSVIAGIVLASWPAVSVAAVAFVAGFWLIVFGVTQLGLGMQMRRVRAATAN